MGARKTISFGEHDKELFQFCYDNSEAKGKKFAAYVKEVLREKMDQGTLDTLIEKKIEEYFKNHEVQPVRLKREEKEEAVAVNISAIEYKDEDKNALLSFMKGE